MAHQVALSHNSVFASRYHDDPEPPHPRSASLCALHCTNGISGRVFLVTTAARPFNALSGFLSIAGQLTACLVVVVHYWFWISLSGMEMTKMIGVREHCSDNCWILLHFFNSVDPLPR